MYGSSPSSAAAGVVVKSMEAQDLSSRERRMQLSTKLTLGMLVAAVLIGTVLIARGCYTRKAQAQGKIPSSTRWLPGMTRKQPESTVTWSR